jgi:serine phosphatase RsbU (regulator of sigma subunit)/anti-sigma regulatory factor (Ser/Thr protein kinase)
MDERRARQPLDRAPADGVLVVAFLIDTTIAIVDAFTPILLVNLVVAGPLIAATRATPRRTAWIALYALALGIYEGVPHHILGSGDHVVRCLAIALTGGLAVWGAWLRTRAEAAQHHVALLAEAGAVLNTSLDEAATARTIAGLVTRELADCCAVHTFDRQGQIRHVAVAESERATQPIAEALSAWAAAPEPSADGGLAPAGTGPPEEPTATLRAAIRALGGDGNADGARPPAAVMVVPMSVRDRTLGAITFVSTHGHRVFDTPERQTARDLAARCAMALDNAEQYQERSQVAGALQAGLLPVRLPRIPGVEIAARFHAADDVEVGGDFFDVFPAAGGWAVVVGDVSGKGASAAAVTALARYTVRAVAETAREPAAVLRALNEALLREELDERFCTTAYALLRETGDGVLVRACAAGHPPPLVVEAGGQVAPLTGRGMALGIAPNPPLAESEITLCAGDKLVLYTDGVIEARVGSGMLGIDGLSEVLAGTARDDTVLTGEQVYRAAEPRSTARHDDIAVVVLRATGAASAGNEGLARTGASGRRGVLQLRLRGGLHAPWIARRALDALELPLLDPADAHRSSLLVSEIVSNSVRHAPGPPHGIGFDADLTPERLAVEVRADGASFHLDSRHPPLDEASRRGLVLLDRLADRWGTRDDGHTVWFELDRER